MGDPVSTRRPRPTLLVAAWCAANVATGCATPLTLVTEPANYEITIVSGPTGQKNYLGRSPVELSTVEVGEFVEQAASSPDGKVEILLSRPESATQRVKLPSAQIAAGGTLLLVVPESTAMRGGDLSTYTVVQRLYNVHRFIQKKELERALVEVDEILSIEPDFPRAYFLRATVHFLNKNYADSLRWAETALRNDPSMEDAIHLIAENRKRLGIQTPVAPLPTAAAPIPNRLPASTAAAAPGGSAPPPAPVRLGSSNPDGQPN